jgi:hypothetical protein
MCVLDVFRGSMILTPVNVVDAIQLGPQRGDCGMIVGRKLELRRQDPAACFCTVRLIAAPRFHTQRAPSNTKCLTLLPA